MNDHQLIRKYGGARLNRMLDDALGKSRRYRVEVTITVAHFVDATSEADAIAGALELTRIGARPAYETEPTANAEAIAETEAA